MREGEPKFKIAYNVFKEQYGCDPFFYISSFSTLIHLADFLGGIQKCVTVVSKWIFDKNIAFALSLTCNDMDNCFTTDAENLGISS